VVAGGPGEGAWRGASGAPGELSRLGELGLLARLLEVLGSGAGDPGGDAGASGVLVGPGDDGAVLAPTPGARLVLTTDTIVEGRHFSAATSAPQDWGWKAVAVNVSDVVAMGGTARWLVVALVLPAVTAVELVTRVYQGIAAAARAFGVAVVGGDISSGRELSLAVAAVGEVDRPVRRDGARPGDRLAVTGPVGAAAAGLGLLALGSAAADEVLARYPGLAAAHRRPSPDPGAGVRLAAAGATAMLDVSDGLAADVLHLAVASGVGVELHDAAVPLAAGVEAAAAVLGADPMELALGGGEDFVLAAALPRAADAAGVIDCGRFTDRPDQRLRRAAAGPLPLAGLGWDHFAGVGGAAGEPA